MGNDMKLLRCPKCKNADVSLIEFYRTYNVKNRVSGGEIKIMEYICVVCSKTFTTTGA